MVLWLSPLDHCDFEIWHLIFIPTIIFTDRINYIAFKLLPRFIFLLSTNLTHMIDFFGCHHWPLALWYSNQYTFPSKHWTFSVQFLYGNISSWKTFTVLTFSVFQWKYQMFVCIFVCGLQLTKRVRALIWHWKAKRLLQGIGIICKIMCAEWMQNMWKTISGQTQRKKKNKHWMNMCN